MKAQVGFLVLGRAIGDHRVREVAGLGRAGVMDQALMAAEIMELIRQLGREQLDLRAGPKRHLGAPCGKRAAAGHDDGLAADIEENGEMIQSALSADVRYTELGFL